MTAMFVGSPLFIILCVGIGPAVWFLMLNNGRRSQARAQSLMATGARGRGVVTNVGDTGVTINENPRIMLTARITPEDGSPAFDAQQTVTVSRIAIPRVGDQLMVWYDRTDPSQWAWQAMVGATVPTA
jgi:preprotein translocase subunit YajC